MPSLLSSNVCNTDILFPWEYRELCICVLHDPRNPVTAIHSVPQYAVN